MGKREQNRIKNTCSYALEERIRLLDLLGEFDGTVANQKRFQVIRIEDAERVAQELRVDWGLGRDPIPNMVSLLENKRIHVIEIDTEDGFDGVSLQVFNDENQLVSWGIALRRGISGDRQRFSLAHELGHLIPDVISNIDQEKVANRFAGSFLAPADALFRDVGRYRQFISIQELILLKQRYKMSIQALLYRLHELEVINAYLYKKWCIIIDKMGWRKNEPVKINPEIPQWIDLLVHQAFTKQLISKQDALQILSLGKSNKVEVTLVGTKEFGNMSIDEHEDLLKLQISECERLY